VDNMKVAVIGSTGFLGEQICDVVSQLPGFEIRFISAYRNYEKLLHQAHAYHVPSGYLIDHHASLAAASHHTGEEPYFLREKNEVRELLMSDAIDGIFFASSGIDCIDLFYDLLTTDKIIWMANKEIIVAGNELWKGKRDLKTRKNLLALDSEHNAISQLLYNLNDTDIAKIYLTASGGAFYEWQGNLNEITPEMALSHPNWKMGAKITVDSANLVNKGLEVIEANCLFGFSYQQIDVLVQRESIIHALIELQDGFVMALLSKPDMKSVILHAISPHRKQGNSTSRLDFTLLKTLHFDHPVPNRFRGFYLAVEAGRRGGGFPAFFCGADEACVQAFLNHRILFNDIPVILEKAMDTQVDRPSSVEEVIGLFHQGYVTAKNLIQQRSSLKC